MVTRLIVLGALASCLRSPAVHATVAPAQGAPSYRNGIQAGIMELLWREYSVKYERMVTERDGLEVEGSVIDSDGGSGYTVGIGYRRHRPGRFVGRFWGPFLTYKDYDDEYEEKVDGEVLVHPYSVRGAAVGLNIGHRWLWPPGLSAVLRLGYGIPLMKIQWKDTRPADHPDAIKGLLTFMQGLDAEISLGYCL